MSIERAAQARTQADELACGAWAIAGKALPEIPSLDIPLLEGPEND